MNIHSMLAASAITGLSLIALTAAAADSKSFHGASCKTYGLDTMPQQFSFDERGVQNMEQGSGSSAHDVICPLLRDNTGSSSQIGSVYVEFHNSTVNNHTSWSCTLYTQTEDGESGQDSWIWDSQTESTTATGFTQLHFSNISTTDNNEGSYAVKCSVGPRDTLQHVYVSEN